VRLNVTLGCDLANVPAAAVDAFKASADRLFNAALERVKELAAAYAEVGEPPRPVRARDAYRAGSRHSLAARAARSVSDAAAGIASVLIVSEEERGEAERLVDAHCASVNDKDPSIGPGRRGGAAGAAGGRGEREGGRRASFLRRMVGSSGGSDFSEPTAKGRAPARPCCIWATCDGSQARGAGSRVAL
jgi:hypothetical protein